MTKFTIYTQHKNLRLTRHLATMHLGNFTIIKATGYWQGAPEKSLLIEYLTVQKEKGDIYTHKLVRDINTMNKQTCCLVTRQEIQGDFI